jgi:hypothetical protein
MTLVERLRAYRERNGISITKFSPKIMIEAADAIEAQAKLIAEIRATPSQPAGDYEALCERLESRADSCFSDEEAAPYSEAAATIRALVQQVKELGGG